MYLQAPLRGKGAQEDVALHVVYVIFSLVDSARRGQEAGGEHEEKWGDSKSGVHHVVHSATAAAWHVVRAAWRRSWPRHISFPRHHDQNRLGVHLLTVPSPRQKSSVRAHAQHTRSQLP